MCSVHSDFSVVTYPIAMPSVYVYTVDTEYGAMRSNEYVHERHFYTRAPTHEQDIVQRDSLTIANEFSI
jgi:hypothetical protein